MIGADIDNKSSSVCSLLILDRDVVLGFGGQVHRPVLGGHLIWGACSKLRHLMLGLCRQRTTDAHTQSFQRASLGPIVCLTSQAAFTAKARTAASFHQVNYIERVLSNDHTQICRCAPRKTVSMLHGAKHEPCCIQQ